MNPEQPEPKFSPWSQQFLWIMGSMFLLGPVAGAFIFTTAGMIVETDDSPLQLAINGAKIVGTTLGFCAPFIALFAVVRSVKNQPRESEQRDENEELKSGNQADR